MCIRDRVKGDWLFDQHVFWLGGFYEICYLGLIMDVTSADWQTQLRDVYKRQAHRWVKDLRTRPYMSIKVG